MRSSRNDRFANAYKIGRLQQAGRRDDVGVLCAEKMESGGRRGRLHGGGLHAFGCVLVHVVGIEGQPATNIADGCSFDFSQRHKVILYSFMHLCLLRAFVRCIINSFFPGIIVGLTAVYIIRNH
jgi:hypothetical protein